ncbi:MAG: hypothetical protein P4L31_06405, partial [Candidatus Babeliales bacterium]|nr:hypothetical protein [Candidatus Babeliales bacterium]
MKLQQVANKIYPTLNNIMYVRNIEILASPLSYQGGCHDGNCRYASESIKFDANTILKIKSYKASHNNCLIQCFNIAYGVNGRTLKPNAVRDELKIPRDVMIPHDQIPILSAYDNKKFNMNKGYKLMNQKYQYLHAGGNPKDYIDLFLRNDHY